MNIIALIQRYGIISDQIEPNELRTILTELQASLTRSGNIVEFGCYTGTTSLYIRRVLDTDGAYREFHVYDSFEGLPEKRSEDTSPLGLQFIAGELAVSKKQFIREFQEAQLELPTIHKGWFSDLSSSDVPDDISFAFLDGDYYESVKTPLELIAPKLAKNATIIVDDYANPALPGAKQATDEWCQRHGYSVRVAHSLAIIHS